MTGPFRFFFLALLDVGCETLDVCEDGEWRLESGLVLEKVMPRTRYTISGFYLWTGCLGR